MTLPLTDAGYAFEEEKTVAVGDPTEAVDDHNNLAENTDWLREAKMTGWRGYCFSDQTRSSLKNGTGTFWIGRVLSTKGGIGHKLVDATDSLGDPIVPLDEDGLKYRSLYLTFTVTVFKSDYISQYDADEILPHGQFENFLTGDTSASGPTDATWATSSNLISMVPLYAGNGNTAYDANDDDFVKHFVWTMPIYQTDDVDIWVWVDRTTGDLMIRWDGHESHQAMTVFGYVTYGPAWVDES